MSKSIKDIYLRKIKSIPKAWLIQPINNFCYVKGRIGWRGLKKKEFTKSGPYLITGTDIENERVNWSKCYHITEERYEESPEIMVQKNDIILTKDGTIGKVAYIDMVPDKTSLNSHLFLIRTNDNVLSKYLFYYLQSSIFHHYIEIEKVGSTRPALTQKKFEKFKVLIPPFEEQEEISSFLFNLDKIITKTQQVIENLNILKKGLMQRLFTEGIGHTEFKETRLGKIPKEWGIKKLGEIINIYDSERIPLSQAERNERKGIYPYCGATGIIDYIDDYIFDGEYVLLAEDGGPFGKFENSAYIMSGKFWVNNHAHVIQAIQGQTTSLYLLYVLNYLSLIPYIVGSTRQKLNQGDLKKIKIPVPNLEEQESIVKIFSNLDNKIVNKNQSMSTLKEIKKGLMQELLTGRKRVRVSNFN